MKITRKGYAEVWKGTEYISRHVDEWKAVMSASVHGEGAYRITLPEYEVIIDDGDDYSPYQGDGIHTEIFTIPHIGITNGTTTSHG